MAQLPDLPAPEMGVATGFHGDNAGRQLAKERQHLIRPQLLAQYRLTRPVSPMRFDMICEANGIEHRLTKPNHPWTNGQVESG